MTRHQGHDSPRDAWARLRFAIVSPLLASPPRPGKLTGELELLAGTMWRHPLQPGDPASGAREVRGEMVTGDPGCFAVADITLGLRDTPASTVAVLGIAPNGLPTAPTPPLMLDPVGLITLNFTTSPLGCVAFSAPASPAILAGGTFTFQRAALDPTFNYFAFSNAASIVVQP